MRYLFFDIECADGDRAICEFGYVICDYKFNVLQKKNILMNPEARFNLTGRKDQRDLYLTYKPEEYRKHDPFPEFYDNIKFMLTQHNLLIYGHGVDNDIRFILKDCEHYKLPIFDYTAYDIQKMLPIFDSKNIKYTCLDNAYNDLVDEGIRNTLLDHRAGDDAMKTMLVFKAMVKELDFSVKELIEACPSSKIKTLELWKHVQEKAFIKAHPQIVNENSAIWKELYEKDLLLLEDPNSIGKFVTISNKLKAHIDKFNQVLQIIKDKGYVACRCIEGTDFFILLDESNKQYLLKKFAKKYNGKMLTVDEFLELNK